MKTETEEKTVIPTTEPAANQDSLADKKKGTQIAAASEADRDAGARVRKRNAIIAVVCGVIFFGGLFWLMKTGKLADTSQIQKLIEKSGFFGPILFILISVFSSFVPIIPMGSMGSIGIVLFGPLMAFIYNSLTSMINCLIAYWLALRYGNKIILWFAAPETVEKYEGWLKKSKHFELIFFICMMMPVSPDLVLCMIAGLMGLKFSHFLIIILISRPFSSWCYSTGLLKVFEWLRHLFHL